MTRSGSGACADIYHWASNEQDDIAVTVTVSAPDRSMAEQTNGNMTIPISLPSDEIEVAMERGANLSRNKCTDSIDSASEPASPSRIAVGEGEIVFDAASSQPHICGTVNATLTITGLVARDGTRIAPIDVSSNQIGCFAG